MNVFGDAEKAEEYGTAHPGATDVEGVVVVGYDPASNKWLALQWHEKKTIWLVGGGREPDEPYEQSAVRELKEETGYSEFQQQVQLGGPIRSHYYNDKKGLHRRSNALAFLFVLSSGKKGEQELEEHEKFDVVWLDYEELRESLKQTSGGVEHWLAVLARARDYVKYCGW
jgi:8-oxo-dGTP pyrophosphatase MutT (NUDIX family)